MYVLAFLHHTCDPSQLSVCTCNMLNRQPQDVGSSDPAWSCLRQAHSSLSAVLIRLCLHPANCSLPDALQFAREIVSKISPDTIADIRTHWGTTGRMSVTCGPAGRKGLSGIFTLNPAGRPVIWAPRNSSALSKLQALVAAGGGGAEVPAGYEEIEPKVFEDRAGKSKTHNWQLSIVLTGRLLMQRIRHCMAQDAACKMRGQRRLGKFVCLAA